MMGFADMFPAAIFTKRRSLGLTVCCLLLASCGGEPEPAPVEETTATATGARGDVLPGSISDAMLPLDTVTSTAPRAANIEGEDDGGSDDDTSDETNSIADAPGDDGDGDE
ncbi:MAG: hypothetical protein WA948_08460 [Pontixanthobacter sp.]